MSLPFFDKKAEECESDFDKWIYVLKHMEALERMPFTAQKKIFKRLAELADSRCLSQEEQEKYDESLKAADDYYGVFSDNCDDYFVLCVIHNNLFSCSLILRLCGLMPCLS